MEVRDPQHGQFLEIRVDVGDGERSVGGSKICGKTPCGFSDAGTNSKDAEERSASVCKLFIAVVLCIIFMCVEVVGGIKANSLAILTDAAHLLSEVAAFGISLFSLWAAGWEANPRQDYGPFRIKILGALVSIHLVWLLAGILVNEAIARLINKTGEVNGFLMFLVAASGLVVNVIMALFLGNDHGHSHGDHAHGIGHSHAVSITAHHHHDRRSTGEHCPHHHEHSKTDYHRAHKRSVRTTAR